MSAASSPGSVELPEDLVRAHYLGLVATSPAQLEEARRLVELCSEGHPAAVRAACEAEAARRLEGGQGGPAEG